MPNEITIRIRGDNSDARAAVEGVAASARAAGDRIAADLSRSMQTLGKAMTAAVTVPLAGIAGGSLKAAIDFESAFAGVRKTVDGTEAQIKELERGIRELALVVPVGTTELSRIAEAAGQLGIKRESILGFTKTIAAMGVATNLAGDEAATAMARLINITGDAQDKISNLGAAIVALGNDGASTEKEIVDMALRLGGAGRAAGLATTDILGIANALSSMGIEAEAGGTAFSRVMIDMFEATKTGGEKLALFAGVAGMTAAQFKAAFERDAASAITAFVVGLGKAKDAGTNIFPVLDKLELGEVRVRDALLRASGAQQVLTNSIDVSRKAWADNTALAAEAEKRYATTAKQLELLKNKVADVAIDLGETLVPALHKAVDAADPLVKALKELAAEFAAMPKQDQENLLKTLAALAAAGPTIYVIGGIAGAVGTLAKALSAVGAAAAAHPLIAAAAVAVGALAAATYALAQVNKPPIAGEELADLAVTKGLGEMNREIERSMGLITDLGPVTEQMRQDMANLAEGMYAAASLVGTANDAIGQATEEMMERSPDEDRAWAKDAARKLRDEMAGAGGTPFPTVPGGGGKKTATADPSWAEASNAAVSQGVMAALAHEAWRKEIKKMVADGDLEKAAEQYRLLGKDAQEAIDDILSDLRELDQEHQRAAEEQKRAAEELAAAIEQQWAQVREAVAAGMQTGAEGFEAMDANARRWLDLRESYAEQEKAIQRGIVDNYIEGLRQEHREGVRLAQETLNARLSALRAEGEFKAQQQSAEEQAARNRLNSRMEALQRQHAQQAYKSALLQRFGTESEVEIAQRFGGFSRDAEGDVQYSPVVVRLLQQIRDSIGLNVDGVELQRAGNRQAMVRGLAYGAMGGGY